MKLILARHGNTFRPGDKVFYVGGKNDLPLVEQGVAQAERLADVLSQQSIDAVYSAPLKRTKEFAEIAIKKARSRPNLIIDERLTELDYGQWSGLSDDEIREKFGEQCLRDWIEKSAWPGNCGWSGSEMAVRADVCNLIKEIEEKHAQDATVLIVSSNGKLRYFLDLIDGEFEKRLQSRSFKVGTGKVCLLQRNGKGFELCLWNEEPGKLRDFIG